MLSLLPFFQHFREDSPYHLAGVAALQAAMPDELLSTDSEWYEAWQAAGIDQQVHVPYFRQLDNGPNGWRDCFSSAAAMLAASQGVVSSDNEYIVTRSKYGDTTSVDAQLRALRALGLDVVFTQQLFNNSAMGLFCSCIDAVVHVYAYETSQLVLLVKFKINV